MYILYYICIYIYYVYIYITENVTSMDFLRKSSGDLNNSWHIFTNKNLGRHSASYDHHPRGGNHMYFPWNVEFSSTFFPFSPLQWSRNHQGHASPQLAAGHHQPQHQHPAAALDHCYCSAAADHRRGVAAQCDDLRLLGWCIWKGHSCGIWTLLDCRYLEGSHNEKYPQMDSLYRKILLEWMICGYPHVRKPPHLSTPEYGIFCLEISLESGQHNVRFVSPGFAF